MKMDKKNLLSRREFLKLSSIGFVAASSRTSSMFNLLPSSFPSNSSSSNPKVGQAFFPKNLGRVLYNFTPVHKKPSYLSGRIETLEKDSIIRIHKSIDDEINLFNSRDWFEIKKNNYIHSSMIQPVKSHFNSPINVTKGSDVLAEVSIPYTDAFPSPSFNQLPKFRFYYSSTHWIKQTIIDLKERVWYEIKDDKDPDNPVYVPAKNMRAIPNEEISIISPEVYLINKRIEVYLESQTMTAFEHNEPVFSTNVSTGNIDKKYLTPKGSFHTHYKRHSQHLRSNNLILNAYDYPGVPWLSYLTGDGIAFHGAYWHNDFGRPRSHGCINLKPEDAKWVFRWTVPHVPSNTEYIYNQDTNIGTQVDIL